MKEVKIKSYLCKKLIIKYYQKFNKTLSSKILGHDCQPEVHYRRPQGCFVRYTKAGQVHIDASNCRFHLGRPVKKVKQHYSNLRQSCKSGVTIIDGQKCVQSLYS